MKAAEVLAVMLAGVALAACSTITDETACEECAAGDIAFSSFVNRGAVQARGDDDVVGDETKYEVMNNATWHDETIYIHQNRDGQDIGTMSYAVASGMSGQLVRTDGETPRWGGEDVAHIFHAWTQPDGVELAEGATDGVVNFATRNRALERFVGTRRGPVTYGTNRQTVSLWFDHLVGRITINSVTHLMPNGVVDGAAIENMHSLTFSNLPSTATFHTGIGTGSKPYISRIDDGPCGLTLRCYHSRWVDMLYVPVPFVFDEKIRLADGSEVSAGAFYVLFGERDAAGNWKSEPRVYEGDIAEITGEIRQLNAGEEMAVDIILTDDEKATMHVFLKPWNTVEVPDVPVRSHNGVYTNADLTELLKALKAGQTPPDRFVDEDDNGDKVIRIYNDMAYNGWISELTIPPGYVIDGMGHNITAGGVYLDADSRSRVRDLYVNGTPVSR